MCVEESGDQLNRQFLILKILLPILPRPLSLLSLRSLYFLAAFASFSGENFLVFLESLKHVLSPGQWLFN